MSSEVEKRRKKAKGTAAERAARAAAQAEEKAARAAARAEDAGARAAEKADRARDRADAAGRRAAERAEEAGARAARAAGSSGDGVEEPLIWFREEPASRRPAHTRADIARAALEIADSEGFDAVSMRRVAQRLGAGTMTLYHYVRNKDELITLMSDLVMGEVLVPEGELSEDWREAMTAIAHRSHAAFRGHVWVFEQLSNGHPGPNGMRHFEQSLQAVSSLGLDHAAVFELISQVDDYVFGYSLRELQEQEEQERGWPEEVVDFLQRELDSGDYPRVAEFFGDDAAAAVERMFDFVDNEGRFDRGLNRLLDGIEASLPRT